MNHLTIKPGSPTEGGYQLAQDASFTIDGKKLYGVISCDVRYRIDSVVEATLEISPAHEAHDARGVFKMTHPLTGKLAEIRRIEFADAGPFEPRPLKFCPFCAGHTEAMGRGPRLVCE